MSLLILLSLMQLNIALLFAIFIFHFFPLSSSFFPISFLKLFPLSSLTLDFFIIYFYYFILSERILAIDIYTFRNFTFLFCLSNELDTFLFLLVNCNSMDSYYHIVHKYSMIYHLEYNSFLYDWEISD